MFTKEALVAVLIPNIGGIICSKYTRRGQTTLWYKNLKLPRMAPPAWVSGTLWVLYFTSMGLASYFVWNLKGFYEGAYALWLYSLNLVFCFLWAPVFFKFQSLAGGFVVGVVNLVVGCGTTVEFYKVSPVAGLLMLPYLAWLAFNSLYLNHKTYLLNKNPYKML